ncbi:NlpC/P60 family protein [Streptomyces sp. 5.8]|uniref:bifunctional lytic transglycosylase/C40 family peptidase n=1 Tax=Streptomyces sp. 5.8 TaxID=3406571 RepID=UPI003BB4A00A
MDTALKALGCLVTLVIGVVIATVIAVAMAVADRGDAEDDLGNGGFGGGIAQDAPVPDWVRDLILKNIAAHGCPELTPSLVAAQLYSESSFDPKAQSRDPATGEPIADGIAQFIPSTWAQHGVDGDHDGDKDVWDPKDAIPAQMSYDCSLANDVKDVPGDRTDNMLAAYNAGPSAVQKAGGIPPFEQTRAYVKAIRELATKWAAVDGEGGVPLPPGSGGAAQAIATAKQALGTMYQWGGGCEPPFDHSRNRGCDCSSLMQYAWGSAGVNLPRVTYDQVLSGSAVDDIAQLRPGDLLFSRIGSRGPEHVGMYIGNGEVIDAPRSGLAVRIKPLSEWASQIIAMRHVG